MSFVQGRGLTHDARRNATADAGRPIEKREILLFLVLSTKWWNWHFAEVGETALPTPPNLILGIDDWP
jgi:hypothetical protein